MIQSGKLAVISVICRPPDKRIHLAPTERGLGTNVLTLCLEKWTTAEECRQDSELCPECVKKWKEKVNS